MTIEELENTDNPLLAVVFEEREEATLDSWAAWLDDLEPDFWPLHTPAQLEAARETVNALIRHARDSR